MVNKKIAKKGSWIIFLLCCIFGELHAQDDFTTWTSLKIAHRPVSGLTIAGKFELRTKDSMKSFDRWGFAAEANYQIFSFLKAEAGYEIHHRDRGNEGWKFVSPYFSIELYQAIGDAAFWDVARMRYRPGVEIDITDRWSLDVFYCYQYEPDKKKHIAGVECSFTF